MRATRIDQAGRPVYGPCSQVVTKGFVSIELGSETEEGEDITQRTASGELCISEPGQTQLLYRTVSIEFCQVDPDLVTMMNPDWEKEVDDRGNVVGWRGTANISSEAGYALEVWMDTHTPQNDEVCGGTDPNAEGEWGYLLLPRVNGGTWGDFTIENGAVTFTFDGKARTGSRWGRGPYKVIISDGVPSPLSSPIKPSQDHLLRVVGVRPPEAQCGCQPVDRPVPEPATVMISGVPGETGDNRHTVRLTVDNHGFGPVTVDWGESGGTTQQIDECRTVEHRYAETGSYTITVKDAQTPAAYTVTRDIDIPLPPDEPQLDLTAEYPDDTSSTRQITATWDNHGNGPVHVRFGDGFETDGEDTGSYTRTYQRGGIYTVEVQDQDQPSHVSRQTVSVPVPQPPQASAEVDPDDAAGMRVILTVDNTQQGMAGENVRIDWGDGGDTETGPASGTVNHTYSGEGGEQTITVWTVSNELAEAEATVTVDPAAPDVSVEAGNQSNIAVLTVDNHGLGQTQVDWGDDNTADGPSSDGGTVSHTYQDPTWGTEQTITVTSPDTGKQATATFTPTDPNSAAARRGGRS